MACGQPKCRGANNQSSNPEQRTVKVAGDEVTDLKTGKKYIIKKVVRR